MELLAEYVRNKMKEKNLSTYDVQRNSQNQISAPTVTKIVNMEIRSSTVPILKGLAKGLEVSEDEVFRVARGKPITPDEKYEFIYEMYGGDKLNESDADEILETVRLMVAAKAVRHQKQLE